MTALHRRPGIASVATLAGIVLTLGVAHVVAPEWSRAAGLDVWNAGDARAELAATLARGDDLEVEHELVTTQIRGSLGVVTRLADGRLTLDRAVDELIVLNQGRTAWADGLEYAHPTAPTHRHRVARYAIEKLANEYLADPAAWAELSARLEAEYRGLPD
ncbi:MAG: hypothetical protein U0804_00305 [Gemmataceae bacterium]